MSKMITWLSLMAGITLLFYFGGVLNNTPNSSLLSLVLNPGDAENSNVYLAIFGLFGVISSVVSTFIARNVNSDFWILGPVITVLFTFGWDFLNVYRAMASTSAIGGVIAILIFGPLILMNIISVLEWWRGVSP